MTRHEANQKLWFYITDPATLYSIWFEHYGRGNPIVERRDEMFNKFIVMLTELQRMLNEQASLHADVKSLLASTGDNALRGEHRAQLVKLQRELKRFRSEITSPKQLNEDVPAWKKMVGKDSALVAAHILYAFYREKREIKRSDAIDFVHAMYLPHTDLWRGDKAFSDLLIKHKVLFWERVVPTLAELPRRIEAEIARR
jgi:hypothetical protein